MIDSKCSCFIAASFAPFHPSLLFVLPPNTEKICRLNPMPRLSTMATEVLNASKTTVEKYKNITEIHATFQLRSDDKRADKIQLAPRLAGYHQRNHSDSTLATFHMCNGASNRSTQANFTMHLTATERERRTAPT